MENKEVPKLSLFWFRDWKIVLSQLLQFQWHSSNQIGTDRNANSGDKTTC